MVEMEHFLHSQRLNSNFYMFGIYISHSYSKPVIAQHFRSDHKYSSKNKNSELSFIFYCKTWIVAQNLLSCVQNISDCKINLNLDIWEERITSSKFWIHFCHFNGCVSVAFISNLNFDLLIKGTIWSIRYIANNFLVRSFKKMDRICK